MVALLVNSIKLHVLIARLSGDGNRLYGSLYIQPVFVNDRDLSFLRIEFLSKFSDLLQYFSCINVIVGADKSEINSF